jgi:hypothetical protein
MKYNFQVGDLFVTSLGQSKNRIGVIVEIDDKLSYPYFIQWAENTDSAAYKEHEIIDFIKNKSIIYFPIVK